MAELSSVTRKIARLLTDRLGTARSVNQEHQREFTQTTVWFVTLAVGLLTFAAVNRNLLGFLSSRASTWLLALLLLTVFSGSIQRFLLYLYARHTEAHTFELETRLLAAGLEEGA